MFMGLGRRCALAGLMIWAMVVCGQATASADEAPYHIYTGYRDGVSPESRYFHQLVKEVFVKSGIEFVDVPGAPWKRSYMQTLMGSRYVLFPATRTEDREALFKWVGPISRTVWNLYGLAGNGWAGRKIDDILQNAQIGVTQGSARQHYLEGVGADHVVGVPRDDLLLPMLQAGRVDMIAMGGVPLHRLMVDWDVARQTVVKTATYRTCYLYIAMSPDSAPEDVASLQASLDDLKRSGRFLDLRRQFGLRVNTKGSFIKSMLDLKNNGVGCVGSAGESADTDDGED